MLRQNKNILILSITILFGLFSFVGFAKAAVCALYLHENDKIGDSVHCYDVNDSVGDTVFDGTESSCISIAGIMSFNDGMYDPPSKEDVYATPIEPDTYANCEALRAAKTSAEPPGIFCKMPDGTCIGKGEKGSSDSDKTFDGTEGECRFNSGVPYTDLGCKATSDLELPENIYRLNKLGAQDLKSVISRIIMVVMGGTGAIALAMFVFGGFLWMTAAGNSEREKKAFEVLVWTGLGLIVILSSYAILNFVFSIFV